ncbi:MAG TPA: permease prefix domain 1-containing protein [Candidatus Limnocylindrales bacterium]
MRIDWLLAFVWIGGWGAFLIAAIWLVRRSERRLSVGPTDPDAPTGPGPASPDAISTYLDRMSGELLLPAADVAEVRAELADHLQDSIASLETEGLDRERATREALARLGSADELGRHLRHAHQSTRRLLAGVGGGVFAAGGGFVLGYLGGILVALLLALVIFAVTSVLARLGLPMPDLGDHGDTLNSVLLGISVAAAAALATRYAVRTSAGLSRRSPRSIAIFWAAAGAVGFGWYSIFGMRGAQSWPGIVVDLCIPVVVVAAAFVRIERPMPHVGRWAVAIVLISVVGISVLGFAFSAASVSGGTLPALVESGQPNQPDMHFDMVAPLAPAAWLPGGNQFYGGGSGPDWDGTQITAGVGLDSAVPMSTALINWHDVRFEAWHGFLDNPLVSYGIDPHYSSPFAVQPATVHDTYLDAVFHFERMRSAGSWWVMLTAVGPDGHRYRLSDGDGGSSHFNGSAWDWLTAPL